jgi:phosphoribosylformylglycinamidine synthase
LFSESAGRAVVSLSRSEEVRFTDMCTARGLPHARIGVLDVLSPDLEVQGQFSVPLVELRDTWTAALPALFG